MHEEAAVRRVVGMKGDAQQPLLIRCRIDPIGEVQEGLFQQNAILHNPYTPALLKDKQPPAAIPCRRDADRLEEAVNNRSQRDLQ
ncbi:MAG: hypothetical protein Kow00124_04110 [Anaerolineae bacterium]